MNDETRRWLGYAKENLASARVLLDSGLYNPCLQNVQQAVEKMLKAILVESREKLRKTHSISELVTVLAEKGSSVSISEEEVDMLDSIYLPSRYPLGSALPDFEPDKALCRRCLGIAEGVRDSVAILLEWDV